MDHAREPALLLVLFTLLTTSAGCHCRAPSPIQTTGAPLEGFAPQRIAVLDALCAPPSGWKSDPLKHSESHDHQVWLSPTGRTAYGVIRFKLPWPVGHEIALWGFLKQMRETEGESILISKQWDPNLPGLRFVADGGLYTVRTNLFVHGFTGWAVYAGTLRAFPVNVEELQLAERARERTAVDLP